MSARYVVVGIDGTMVATYALDCAAAEAVRRAAELEIVYAVPDLDEAGPVLAFALTRVRNRHPGLPVRATAVAGDPARTLLLRGRDAVLTVVGSRRPGRLAALLPGSVSRRVAAHSRGPLLVVHSARTAQAPESGDIVLIMGHRPDADAAAFAFAEVERHGTQLRFVRAPVFGRGAGHAAAGAALAVVTVRRRLGRLSGYPHLATHALRRLSCPVVLVPSGPWAGNEVRGAPPQTAGSGSAPG